jgi:hypothetical protein
MDSSLLINGTTLHVGEPGDGEMKATEGVEPDNILSPLSLHQGVESTTTAETDIPTSSSVESTTTAETDATSSFPRRWNVQIFKEKLARLHAKNRAQHYRVQQLKLILLPVGESSKRGVPMRKKKNKATKTTTRMMKLTRLEAKNRAQHYRVQQLKSILSPVGESLKRGVPMRKRKIRRQKQSPKTMSKKILRIVSQY